MTVIPPKLPVMRRSPGCKCLPCRLDVWLNYHNVGIGAVLRHIETNAKAVVFDIQENPEFPLAVRIKQKVLDNKINGGWPNRRKDYAVIVLDEPAEWMLLTTGYEQLGLLVD